MPISSVIVRTLHCVALAGRSFTVFSTILNLIAALIGFLPGGLLRPLTRPSTPASMKYSCQRVSVGEQTLEFIARVALEHDLRLPVHQAANESYSHRIRIQMFVTEHKRRQAAPPLSPIRRELDQVAQHFE